MRLNGKKELTPVHYGDSAVKILSERKLPADAIGFDAHWHERMELILVLSGSLQLEVAGRRFAIGENQLAIISPEMSHSGIAGGEGVCYSTLMFDVSLFCNLTAASEKYLRPISGQQTLFHLYTADDEIVELVRSILTEQGSGSSALIVIGKIYELLGLLYRRCLAEEEHAEVRDDRFQEVLDHVARNFCEEISTADLSRRFGYDEAYFCRRFKTVTGLTTMQYIRVLRLEQARRMLRRDGNSISEVAAHCGFSDAGYFARCFKVHFGMTPSQYLKKRL